MAFSKDTGWSQKLVPGGCAQQGTPKMAVTYVRSGATKEGLHHSVQQVHVQLAIKVKDSLME